MSETDDRAAMTAPTPEQMRALADETLRMSRWHWQTNAALRAAADQLEAVQEWADHADPVYADLSALYAILTTDTAPQEDQHD